MSINAAEMACRAAQYSEGGKMKGGWYEMNFGMGTHAFPRAHIEGALWARLDIFFHQEK